MLSSSLFPGMTVSRHCVFLIALLAAVTIATVRGSTPQSRRAILVGIDRYDPDPATRARIAAQASPPHFPRPTATGDSTYWRFDNLDGALNDVALMKDVLADLGITEFVILRDQEATADAILSALQKNLVDDAKAGDIRVFYYSGHGNHIRNLASGEQGGEDQTIVPADNWRDTPDVRDKEISRILWRAAARGVKVTFIADSCQRLALARRLERLWKSSQQQRAAIRNRGLSTARTGGRNRFPIVWRCATWIPVSSIPRGTCARTRSTRST
jgi:hypothetical protein